MFIILLTYTHGLKKIEEHLVEHLAFLDKYYQQNKFICSGAQNPRAGGVILCNANNKEEVNAIILEDPFKINEAATYEIIEFSPSMFASDFETFI